MQFVYHKKAGENPLHVEIKEYEHLFKVRRSSVSQRLFWRNLEDAMLYEYAITEIGKKEAILELISQKEMPILPTKALHLGWCIIDPKIIEKTLPMLNELNVEKISFIYAEFSQRTHRLDFERIRRILINSSQQCGRTSLMKIELFDDLKSYIKEYPNSVVLDFSDKKLDCNEDIKSIIIGPEGGFSSKERVFLQDKLTLGLNCQTILRSETAVVAVASKILG